jgi:hypothetical protein
MKTTMMFRPIANPRRTTLAHLKDAEEPQTTVTEDAAADLADAEVIEAVQLPRQTANPRRTVLSKLPGAQ